MTGTLVFVLAAGKGTRLAPLTELVPKPMVSIGGRPILEHNVLVLAEAGYRDLIVNLHHLPEAVIGHFGGGAAWGVTIDWSFEPALLGTAGALLQREARLRPATFLVVYGDNRLECDLVGPLLAHRQKGATLTIGTIDRPDPGASGVVDADGDGRIRRFIEKPGAQWAGPASVSVGVLVCEPRVLDFIPANGPSDLARDVVPALLQAGELVYATPLDGGIRWIDTPADLAAAEGQTV